ncbi:hypothetical protein A8709_32665 [Paenibacillus pectinilyticus]|uniref:Uncharacterized protein n=1 Tax=Paenibacillus pectinilyticus TaxID=512399 RepID=A0A1C0ZWV2_9BACL|nr:hypothetical protein A8709_32665 [Paenibacillus pectinilyticus]
MRCYPAISIRECRKLKFLVRLIHSKKARSDQHILFIRCSILMFLVVDISKPSPIMLQILGGNAIKAINPTFQTTMVAPTKYLKQHSSLK